jgi:hypothetical protein
MQQNCVSYVCAECVYRKVFILVCYRKSYDG